MALGTIYSSIIHFEDLRIFSAKSPPEIGDLAIKCTYRLDEFAYQLVKSLVAVVGSLAFLVLEACFCAPGRDGSIASASPAARKMASGIVLHFPPDHSLGHIYVFNDTTGRYRSNFKIGEAKGTVRVPKNVTLKIVVDDRGRGDLQILKELPPNMVASINMRKLALSDDQLLKLQGIRGLRRLELNESDVGDRGMSVLNGMADLEFLGLSGTLVTTLKPIEKLINLQGLEASRLPLKNPDEDLRHLAKLRRLNELCLNSSRITDKGVESLSAIGSLSSLEIRLNRGITDAGFSRLQSLSKLVSLDLTGTSVTLASIKTLKRFPNLRSLKMDFRELGGTQERLIRQALPSCQVKDGMNNRQLPLEIFEPLH